MDEDVQTWMSRAYHPSRIPDIPKVCGIDLQASSTHTPESCHTLIYFVCVSFDLVWMKISPKVCAINLQAYHTYTSKNLCENKIDYVMFRLSIFHSRPLPLVGATECSHILLDLCFNARSRRLISHF